MPDPAHDQRLRDLDGVLAALDEIRRSLAPPGAALPCGTCGRCAPPAPAADALGRAAANIERAIALLRKEESEG